MNRWRYPLAFLAWLSVWWCSAPLAGEATRPALDFSRLIADAGMQYTPPAQFAEAALRPNALWAYEHAVRSADGVMEIRYAVRPIEQMRIAYDDPHSNAPEPNHIFPMMFQTLIGLLSDGKHTPSREYPQQQAGEKFNAEWAAAALFDVDTRFNTEHRIALMLALHKSGLADAYVIFLFDDYQVAKPLIDANMTTLVFQ
jgi:hypothetical protein